MALITRLIKYWTDVDIDDDTAARCIYLYLETGHPLLGLFDPDLFVSDLVARREVYCMPIKNEKRYNAIYPKGIFVSNLIIHF